MLKLVAVVTNALYLILLLNTFPQSARPTMLNEPKKLQVDYFNQRSIYYGLPLTVDHIIFDADLVSSCLINMKSGKVAGLDGLTVEYFANCHPAVNSFVGKLVFNFMIKCKYVPV